MSLHLPATDWARLSDENKTLEEVFGPPTDEAIAAPEGDDVSAAFTVDFTIGA